MLPKLFVADLAVNNRLIGAVIRLLCWLQTIADKAQIERLDDLPRLSVPFVAREHSTAIPKGHILREPMGEKLSMTDSRVDLSVPQFSPELSRNWHELCSSKDGPRCSVLTP